MLKNVTDLFDSLNKLIGGGVTTFLMGLAFVAFLLSIINFLWKRRSGDGDGLEQAKGMLGWSVIALFVMVSVWGLVKFISSALGVDGQTTINKPQTVFTSGSPTSVTCSNYKDSTSCNAQATCLWDGRLGGTCNNK
jgi:hypothetical protein